MEYGKRLEYKDASGSAIVEFAVDVNNVLQSDVLLTYSPVHITQNQRPAVIRLPKRVVEQLRALPKEMFGVPIGLLVRVAHGIFQDQGKSVIEEIEKQQTKIIT